MKLTDVKSIIKAIEKIASPDIVEFKREKYNVQAHNSLGATQKDLNALLRIIEKSDALAIQLFDSGVYECRILCGKMFKSKSLTPKLMDQWTATFENWEICDTFCMKLFSGSEHAIDRMKHWSKQEEEFVKRAAFATMAGFSSTHKNDPNEVFESFFPMIKEAADDNRIYVKKAVNWALRSIGKRNVDLKERALEVSYELLESEHKSAVWIAKDAIKELEGEKVAMQDHPRSIYRKE